MDAFDDLRTLLPTAGSAMLRGLRRDFLVLGAGATGVLAAGLLCAATLSEPDLAPVGLVMVPFLVLILGTGLVLAGLLSARGGRVTFRTLLAGFLPPGQWLANTTAALVIGLAVGAGLLLLIVPGLVLLGRLGFTFLYMNEGGMGLVGSLRASWTLTAGRTGVLAGLTAASVLLLVAGIAAGGVGAIPVLAGLVVVWGALFDLLREEQVRRAD